MSNKGFRAVCFLSIFTLAGCSSFPTWMDPTTWFDDEEEVDVQNLAPINALFEVEEIWRESVGDGVENHFSRLSPALAYDMIFSASRQGIVKAFNKDNGQEIWSTNLATYRDEGFFKSVSKLWSDGISAKISGGLAVAYRTVYLGTENGYVIALDVDTGDVKWQTSVKGEVLAKPVIDSGVVVVNTGSGILYALDAQSGEQNWTYESEVPPLSLRGIAAPTVTGGAAIVGTANGKLAVTILDSGQTIWEQTIAAPTGATELERMVDIDSQALALGGIAYIVSYNGTLAAVELRSGRTTWKREYRSYRRISIDGNSLFVVDDNSQIYALDRRNGVELWTQTSLRGRSLTAGAPVANYVVVGDKFGFLHWIDQSTGDIVSRMEVGGDDEDEGIYAAPIVENRILYTQTRDGELVAVRTP